MPYYKFKNNDSFYNVIKTHPVSEFSIYNGKVYYNNRPQVSGAFTSSVPSVPPGNVNLLELNIDRNKDDHLFVPKTIENDDLGTTNATGNKSVVFPFVEKNSDQNLKLKHITDTEYNTHYSYGEMITGSYPLSASIKREFYALQDLYSFEEPEAVDKPGRTRGATGYTRRPRIQALRNTLDNYIPMSHHYAFSQSVFHPDETSPVVGWRKDLQELNLISIPSIYYGQSIKRGSVDLKFYVKGKLVGRARDIKKNGELIDTSTHPFSRRSIFFDGYHTPIPDNPESSNVANVSYDMNPVIPLSEFLTVPDSIKIASHSSLYGISQLTVSMWIKRLGSGNPDTPSYLMHISEKHALYIDIDNKIKFHIGDADSNVDAMWSAAGTIDEGEWYHIAVSYDGTSTSNNPVIYVNGTSKSITEEDAPSATINTANNSGVTTIGNSTFTPESLKPLSGMYPFEGYIDEVSLWNDNLSSGEVSAIYNSGHSCDLSDHSKYANLVSWWRMGEVTDIESDGLDHNGDEGTFPNGIGEEPISTNFIIPDEKGSNNGFMVGFADYNLNPVLSEKLEYAKTGIQGVAAPTCLASSVTDLDEGHPVAGVVLYNEGFIILTGSWNLDEDTQSDYKNDGSANDYPRWTYFGSRLTSGSGDTQSDRSHDLSLETKDNLKTGDHSLNDAFFHIALSGTNNIPTRTMLAHAPKGRLNHSNNPTYTTFNSNNYESTGALGYFEGEKVPIKNIVSSSHKNHSASFDKHTYISKIGIYDENRNLIGISKLATPVRKREVDNLTFKIKLDL